MIEASFGSVRAVTELQLPRFDGPVGALVGLAMLVIDHAETATGNRVDHPCVIATGHVVHESEGTPYQRQLPDTRLSSAAGVLGVFSGAAGCPE